MNLSGLSLGHVSGIRPQTWSMQRLGGEGIKGQVTSLMAWGKVLGALWP